jgi:hypothetical protein
MAVGRGQAPAHNDDPLLRPPPGCLDPHRARRNHLRHAVRAVGGCADPGATTVHFEVWARRQHIL